MVTVRRDPCGWTIPLFLAICLASALWWNGSSRLGGSAWAAEATVGEPAFAREGRAFLQKHCLGCHSGPDAKAELSLAEYRDAASLVRGRKVWEGVVRALESGAMPPEDRPRPAASEVRAMVELIRSIFDQADRDARPDPGRVTMRRLNRTEYRNTIRDLVGVDFDPTTQFPADDIGHGFDNIGDVLSLSPVLMERYLAAAETIVARAIVVNPPAPPQRRLAARYTEPASADVAERVIENGWRRMSSDGREAIETGPVHTQYKWDDGGEYVFRTRLYGRGDLPVRVAILVTGQQLSDRSEDAVLDGLVGRVVRPARVLKYVDITASDASQAQLLEVAIPPEVGRERVQVAVVQPAAGRTATVLVEYLALEGPLDTRPASQRRLLATDAQAAPARTREALGRFLLRAYRRPPTPEELERLASRVDAAVEAGEPWAGAMQLAIQAVLCSPKFLFRMELDERPGDPAARPLDDFQLASRLSYFLWSSMPDDQLLDLAGRGELKDRLSEQVRRMLRDERARALVDNFAAQWLQLQRISKVAPDRQLFPAFDESLRAAMLGETLHFFQSIVSEDRSVLDLIDADYTYLNEPLARLYGIADTQGNRVGEKPSAPRGEPLRGETFQRVQLRDGRRGGLLTMASVLTVTSNPTRTSPVKRGRWVLEQILGTPPPPPPPNVPELPEDAAAVAGGSLRERLEVHRKNPSCANCHAKMDPIGFALEHYDAIGGYRDKDGPFAIDASGQFEDGAQFANAADLKRIIREKRDQFARCLAEKMLIYALGRGLEYYDRPTLDKIVSGLEAGQYRFSRLVEEIVRSDAFRLRRGGPPPAGS